ncbi:MAG TPA: hypothetical protein VLU54_03570 [Casimicrobiaceae bacterium]|nr:hypothetical protein [Casimicrobiaceae bacterium]
MSAVALAAGLRVGAAAAAPVNVIVTNPPSAPVPVTMQGTAPISGSVTVTNGTSNPIPVTINGSGNVTSGDSTDLLLDTVLSFESTVAVQTAAIDVSRYKTVRVVATMGGCYLCNTTRFRVSSDYFPLESLDVPFVNPDDFNFSNTYFARTYEVPGQTLTVSGASAVAGATSYWLVRVYGRRN